MKVTNLALIIRVGIYEKEVGMAIIKLYVPTRDKNGKKVDYVPLLKTVVAQFCIFFGGATVYVAYGFSNNKKGRTIEEKVNVVESYSRWSKIKKFQKDIETLAKMIKIELN